MKQLLYIDCCIRGEQSRTRKLGEAFLAALPDRWEVTRLDLMHEGLQPLMPDTLASRDESAARGELDAPGSNMRTRSRRQMPWSWPPPSGI